MPRKKSDKPIGPLEYHLPAIKLPHEFNGSGLEIIGEPDKTSGELWYQDGRCTGISASRAYADLPPRRQAITDGKHAAWFNLERKNKLQNSPADTDLAIMRFREQSDRDKAASLGDAFADAMMKGKLMPLIREVEAEYSREAKRSKSRKDRKTILDGVSEALSTIAIKSTHPSEVTVSAIMEFLNANKNFCMKYGITPSMKSSREVRKRLEAIGFVWIGHGRPRGRPASNL